MKLPQDSKEQLMAEFLELLDFDATEDVEEIKRISGHDLMRLHGIYANKDGAPILYNVDYNMSTTTTRKVNHRERIGQIIADAANFDEVLARLGEHLAKFAKDRAAVVASIPVRMSINNIPPNDN